MADKRAQPTPRADGMANIVDATMRLLQQRSPADITLRDVARKSGHGHRLIVEWFGGKGGLYFAVFERIFRDLAATGELFFSDIATRSEIRTAVRLVNYMQMHHRELMDPMRSNFALDTVRQRLQTNLGLSEEQASLAARRLALQTMGIATFAEFVALTDDEIIQMMRDEMRSTTGFVLPDNPNRT